MAETQQTGTASLPAVLPKPSGQGSGQILRSPPGIVQRSVEDSRSFGHGSAKRLKCECFNVLNAFTLPNDVALSGSPIRARMLDLFASEFQTAFTGIRYEVDTHTRIVNAQAFGLGDKRIVRLYGGLAFHPLVNEDALIFTLLHETGHHRARGRRFAGNPLIACDCLADKWAVSSGANALRRASGRTMNLANALKSLDALIASLNDGTRSHLAAPTTRKSQLCWTGCWRTRKSRLTAGDTCAPTGPCYFQFQTCKRR
jgi:hypothetical protein